MARPRARVFVEALGELTVHVRVARTGVTAPGLVRIP